MSLTQDDLKKIKAVVDARADLQDMRFDRIDDRFVGVESRLDRIEDRMATKEQVEQVKAMLTEDHLELAKDVEKLQTLPRRVTILEAKLAK